MAHLCELEGHGIGSIAGSSELSNGVLNGRDDLETLLSGGLTVCNAARYKRRSALAWHPREVGDTLRT